ncbi:hypothetical protein VTH06DRAFT_2744 [Thermothelomyces fergusii]
MGAEPAKSKRDDP